MWLRRPANCYAALALTLAVLSAGCATTKSVGNNIQRAYNHQDVDKQELKNALISDTKEAEVNLTALRKKMAEAYAVLKTNVQKRWGEKDTKVASRTVFVKYTQGYKSRVIADFDHGTLTVETVDEVDPQASLKATIAAALLTTSDPATVDLFSDKDVKLEATRRPYLYGLVHDNHGKSVLTREQAMQFANYLVPAKMQTRATDKEQGGKTALFVQVAMVKNFEAKGAERYQAAVDKYSTQYNVSPSLVLAIMRTESNFNPFAVSGAGAYGLMQLVPVSGGREAMKRVQGTDKAPTQEYLLDPDHNIELGTAYLSVLGNSEFHAINNSDSRDYCVIAAYNTGPGNVTRVFSSNHAQALNNINSLPPPSLFDKLHSELPAEETRQYVVKVTGYRKQFVGLPASGTAAATTPAATAAPAAHPSAASVTATPSKAPVATAIPSKVPVVTATPSKALAATAIPSKATAATVTPSKAMAPAPKATTPATAATTGAP